MRMLFLPYLSICIGLLIVRAKELSCSGQLQSDQYRNWDHFGPATMSTTQGEHDVLGRPFWWTGESQQGTEIIGQGETKCWNPEIGERRREKHGGPALPEMSADVYYMDLPIAPSNTIPRAVVAEEASYDHKSHSNPGKPQSNTGINNMDPSPNNTCETSEMMRNKP